MSSYRDIKEECYEANLLLPEYKFDRPDLRKCKRRRCGAQGFRDQAERRGLLHHEGRRHGDRGL